VTIAGTSEDTTTTVKFKTYKNPYSTSATESYFISILDATGTILDTYETDCSGDCNTLTGASIAVTVSSDSTQVGSSDATFTFAFTNSLKMVSGGTLKVAFPTLKTFTTSYPSLLTSTSTCAKVSTNLSSITCKVETDGLTMTISNLVSADTTGTFSFTIKNVDNPYSTKPLSGFSLKIYDSDGSGVIEQDSDFTLSGITVSTDIDDPTVSVASSNEVEESSQLTIRFAGPVPITADCRVVITIPDDFEVSTSGYGFQSRSGLFTDATYYSVSGQVVTIKACPSGQSYQTGTTHRVVLKSLVENPARVKTTDEF